MRSTKSRSKTERTIQMNDEIPPEECSDEAGSGDDSVPRVIVEMERRRARRKFKLCGAGVLLLGGGLLFCINDGALQDKVSLLSGCVSLFGFFMLFGYKWMLRLQIRKSLKFLLWACGSSKPRDDKMVI